MAVGIIVMSVVVFAKQLAALSPAFAPVAPLGTIAWPWYVFIGTTVTVAAGLLATLLPRGGAPMDSSTA